MVTEDYVSFEVAKLLKEKGFDGITEKWYLKYKGEYTLVSRGTAEHPDSSIDVPTIQMAMKWLREKHILVLPEPKSFTLDGEVATWVYNIWCDDNCEVDADFFDGEPFEKYEDACEAGIKYCLENFI